MKTWTRRGLIGSLLAGAAALVLPWKAKAASALASDLRWASCPLQKPEYWTGEGFRYAGRPARVWVRNVFLGKPYVFGWGKLGAKADECNFEPVRMEDGRKVVCQGDPADVLAMWIPQPPRDGDPVYCHGERFGTFLGHMNPPFEKLPDGTGKTNWCVKILPNDHLPAVVREALEKMPLSESWLVKA